MPSLAPDRLGSRNKEKVHPELGLPACFHPVRHMYLQSRFSSQSESSLSLHLSKLEINCARLQGERDGCLGKGWRWGRRDIYLYRHFEFCTMFISDLLFFFFFLK